MFTPPQSATWHHWRVPPWFDTHVHLDRYAEPERAAVVERAASANVAIVGIPVDIESSRALAGASGAAGYAVGVHPKHALTLDASLGELARGERVVAIGECGFDSAAPNPELQQRVFRAQCSLARSLKLPLVLHLDGDTAWSMFSECAEASDGLVVVRHYFTGDAAEAEWHGKRGHYLSFGNPLRRRSELRDIARLYPAELLLIETDSYPAPGRNTEPCHVTLVGETLALVRDWTFDQAREQLAENSQRAFPRLTSR